MKARAIVEAGVRLDRMREAVRALDTDDWDFPVLEYAWWRFLLAASGFYSKLEQGAKGHGQSMAWYGRVKHVRKKDPLLSYLHHARDGEEHSIEGSATPAPIRLKSVKNAKGFRNVEGDIERIEVAAGATVNLSFALPGLRLLSVTDDRFGDTFHPPTVHLGKVIPDPSPREIAKLALLYFAELFVEASTLPVHI